MRKLLKNLFYIIIAVVMIVLAAAVTIYVKYRNITEANISVKYEKAIVSPSTGKVPLGETVEITYTLKAPWDKRPAKLTLVPGKGSQSVGNPEFIKEKLKWGYYIWEVKCRVQPFVNGEIPEGNANIVISPDKDGKMSELKLKFPKIFSEEIPITKNTLNVATTIQEQKILTESNTIYYIIAGILAVIILIIGYLIYMRKRKGKIVVLTSWADALLELNKLKHQLKEKVFNTEKGISFLADIVRNYLEARFKIHAPRQTTEEFLKDMESWKSPLDNKDRNFLREFMITADMIKFAKLDATEKQVTTAIERAEKLIKVTIPEKNTERKNKGTEDVTAHGSAQANKTEKDKELRITYYTQRQIFIMDFFELQNFVKGFRFESPWLLLLIIPLLILFILALIRKVPSLSIPWIKPFLLSKTKRKFKKNSIPIVLYFIAAFFMIIALARPQQGLEQLKQRAKGIDIMLALDLSGSMKAIDIPRNLSQAEIAKQIQNGQLKERIGYAKNEIKNFIEKRPNDRIGLVVFAPLPYVACPPTLDHAWLMMHLSKVDAGMIGDATNIAAPITSAVNRLKDLKSKRKVLIFFTDGANNVEDRISPLQAAKLAKMYNVIIYTVGIGSQNAYVLQNTPFGSQFIPVMGQFDDKLMKDIAKITDGKYYSVESKKGLQDVLNKIDKLEKTTVETPLFIDYAELGPKLLIIALLFFIMGLITDNLFCVRIP